MSGAATRQADVRTIQAWRIQNILQSIAQCPASVFSVHGAASGSCVPATMELSLPGHTPPPGCLCSTGESAGGEMKSASISDLELSVKQEKDYFLHKGPKWWPPCLVSRKIISEWVAGGCISGTPGTWSLVTTSCPASITPVSRGGALSVECRVLQSAECPASRYT